MKPASESISIRIPRLSDWLAALPWMIGVLLSFLSILHFGLPAWFPGRMTEDMNSSAPDYPLAFETLKMAWTFGVALAAIGFMELRGAAGRWLPLAILLTALALAQAWLWQSAHSKYVLLGGLIPFSDASVYTEYANTIVQGRQVGFALQDRPMFAALLASLLLFCGRNPQCALGLLLLLAGTSMCLAARSVRVWFGRAAAVVFQVVVWLYYARWIGTTMTEQLGLILGLLACPFLITGFMEKRRVIWLAGIVVLTMALCSRAGAFFVLPALLFITAGHFAVQGRFAWKFSAQSFGAVVVVMALSRVLAFCVFDADNFPRSNFDYTAYGVVFGTRWESAFSKYGTHHDKIWAAISQHVRKSPFSVPRGMWRAWREFWPQRRRRS